MGRLQNNPSIRWVHPKSTHAHPLAWGNNNIEIDINNDRLLVTIWEHMKEIKRGEDEGILLN
jgi:hypothetical protein